MAGVRAYKGLKLSSAPPTTADGKINTYNFKELAKRVSGVENTYISTSNVNQYIEGDKIFQSIFITDVVAGNFLTVDVSGQIIDSGYSFSDFTSGGGSANIDLIAGSNIAIIESPINTFTISVTGDFASSTTVSNISSGLDNRLDILELRPISDIFRTEVSEISGYLNNKIDSTNIIAGVGVGSIESPSNVWTISVTGNYAPISYVQSASANSFLQSQNYTNTVVSNISGYLQSQILGITGGSGVGNVDVFGGNGISVIENPANVFLINVSGSYATISYVQSISSNLQTQIDSFSAGAITGAASGDLDGDYPAPIVVQVHGRDKTLTYDGSDNLIYLTDEYGSKSFTYTLGLLTSISGSGRYQSKSFIYDGNDNLININVI